jgi:hypothetical protein
MRRLKPCDQQSRGFNAKKTKDINGKSQEGNGPDDGNSSGFVQAGWNGLATNNPTRNTTMVSMEKLEEGTRFNK